jgi:hypothetical protein
MNRTQNTANHQQTRWTNGKEKPGDTVQAHLRNCLLDYAKRSWAKVLPIVQDALHDAESPSTEKKTPNFVVFVTRTIKGWDQVTEEDLQFEAD